MAYSVIVTLRGGRVVSKFDVFNAPTPKVGDTIDLEQEGRTMTARVTSVGRTPARRPTAQTIDMVSATET